MSTSRPFVNQMHTKTPYQILPINSFLKPGTGGLDVLKHIFGTKLVGMTSNGKKGGKVHYLISVIQMSCEIAKKSSKVRMKIIMILN